jgi:hypothetical protein
MYVKIVGDHIDQYPYTIEKFRRDNPNVSLPKIIPTAMLEDYSVYEVSEMPIPDYNLLTQQPIIDTLPIKTSEGIWKIHVTISDLAEKTAIKNIRAKRNQLLADTDWQALRDAPPMTDAQTVYRQELRNITEQSGYPFNVEWPTIS